MNSKLSELENNSVPELTQENCIQVRYMFSKILRLLLEYQANSSVHKF